MTGPLLPADDSAALRVSDVAELFKVSPQTVTRWANAGKLPYFTTVGGHRRFRVGAIRPLLVEHTSG